MTAGHCKHAVGRACVGQRLSGKRSPAGPDGFYPKVRDGDRSVLVVSRKIGERILIGDKIAITVVKVAGGSVRIGVEAPAELAVMREELAEEIRRAQQAAIADAELSNHNGS